MSNNTNKYIIHPFEIIKHSNDSNTFGIEIRFERNSEGIGGILITYHLICILLVSAASINFLIDPKVVPGRAGILVTLFLVLANFFIGAQVRNCFPPWVRMFYTSKSKLFQCLDNLISIAMWSILTSKLELHVHKQNHSLIW